jgi:hypothetical protein
MMIKNLKISVKVNFQIVNFIQIVYVLIVPFHFPFHYNALEKSDKLYE